MSDDTVTVPRKLLEDCRDKLRCYQRETGGKYPGGPLLQNLFSALDDALNSKS